MSLNIETSKDGFKILQVEIDGKKKYLGSKYNQQREIDNFISSFGEITEKDNYIIFGLSFGEHIKRLLDLIGNSDKNILVIELNEELIDYCENNNSIKNILSNNKVSLIKEKEKIKEFFKNFINEGNINYLKVSQYCKYLELYKNDLIDMYNEIKNEITKVTLRRNTVLSDSKVFLNNFFDNIKYIAKYSEVNKLKDKYKNKPAIIVSAGPSLSKNIDELIGIENALIFSGGRTLKALMSKGINPSCIGVVDPGEVAYKLVTGYIDKANCPLFFNDCTPSKIIEEHKGNKFYALQNGFVGNALNEEIPSLYGGGSIAHSLTLLAIYMGCNPIIFIGQDLAYTNDQGHDNLAQNDWQNLTFDNYYKNDNDIYVEDIYGRPVRTSIQLNSYRINFEDIIAENDQVEFINATEGGAKIKGTKNEKLKEVLLKLKKERIVPIEEYLDNDDKTEKIIAALKNTLNLFNKNISLCSKGLRIINECRINYHLRKNRELERNQIKLDNIHEEIRNNITEFKIVDPEISKVIYNVEGNNDFVISDSDNEKNIFNKKINKVEALYSGIKEVLENNYGKIEDIIKELEV